MFPVVVPPPSDETMFDELADYPVFWNVHSTYNDGYRITKPMWEWFRTHQIECYEWDIVYYSPEDKVPRGGVVFHFEKIEHARLFALSWT